MGITKQKSSSEMKSEHHSCVSSSLIHSISDSVEMEEKEIHSTSVMYSNSLRNSCTPRVWFDENRIWLEFVHNLMIYWRCIRRYHSKIACKYFSVFLFIIFMSTFSVILPYFCRKLIPDEIWERVLMVIVSTFVQILFRICGIVSDNDSIGTKFNRPLFERINLRINPTFPKFIRHVRTRDVPLQLLTRNSASYNFSNFSLHKNLLYARIFEPEISLIKGQKVPLLIYFHGGGHVLQHVWDIEQNKVGEKLSRKGPLVVLSIEYRLAPEHKYPSNINDMKQVVKWLIREISNEDTKIAREVNNFYRLPEFIDWNNIIFGGDSAGGTLASAACIFTRDNFPFYLKHISNQLLIYPSFALIDTYSQKNFSDSFVLNESNMHFFIQAYAGYNVSLIYEEIFKDPFINPLSCERGLKSLPPAYFIVPGRDPLQDDSYIYAKYLQYAGVPVSMNIYPNMGHGFFSMSIFSASEGAMDDFVAYLRMQHCQRKKENQCQRK